MKEVEELVAWYGKTFHFWQVDRGDRVPMGGAELMGSFTGEEQVEQFEGAMKDRDQRFGVDRGRRRKLDRTFLSLRFIQVGRLKDIMYDVRLC